MEALLCDRCHKPLPLDDNAYPAYTVYRRDQELIIIEDICPECELEFITLFDAFNKEEPPPPVPLPPNRLNNTMIVEGYRPMTPTPPNPLPPNVGSSIQPPRVEVNFATQTNQPNLATEVFTGLGASTALIDVEKFTNVERPTNVEIPEYSEHGAIVKSTKVELPNINTQVSPNFP